MFPLPPWDLSETELKDIQFKNYLISNFACWDVRTESDEEGCYPVLGSWDSSNPDVSDDDLYALRQTCDRMMRENMNTIQSFSDPRFTPNHNHITSSTFRISFETETQLRGFTKGIFELTLGAESCEREVSKLSAEQLSQFKKEINRAVQRTVNK